MFENYGTILHATDFSDASIAAFEFACRLARDHQSKLTILHVLTPAVVVYSQEVRISRHAAAERIERLTAPACIQTERRIVRGDPVAAILGTATDVDAGVIVIGKKTCGLKRLYDNSVGEQIVRRADRPVLTVSAQPAGASFLPTRRKSCTSSARIRAASDLSGARRIAEG
jgi:nucleotide-binding universal stress UspA family protein